MKKSERITINFYLSPYMILDSKVIDILANVTDNKSRFIKDCIDKAFNANREYFMTNYCSMDEVMAAMK